MGTYYLTAFEKTGKTLLDETFEANNESEAKEKGNAILAEKDCFNTHTDAQHKRDSLFYFTADNEQAPPSFYQKPKAPFQAFI